jgi:hypothetical protein
VRIAPGHDALRACPERSGDRVAIRRQRRNIRLACGQPLLGDGAIDHLRTVVAGKKTAMV